jgi:hypothetical protein
LSTSEVPLARLWQLSDGTSCVLFKDPSAENWQLRVIRGTDVLRTEIYGSAIVAMDEGKRWRASFDSSLQPSSSEA